MSLRCMFTLMGNMNGREKKNVEDVSMNADDATMGSILSIVEK